MLFSTITFNILSQVFSIGTNVWLSIWSISNSTEKSDQDYYMGIYGALGAGQGNVLYLIIYNFINDKPTAVF